jgi:hypothetical protein
MTILRIDGKLYRVKENPDKRYNYDSDLNTGDYDKVLRQHLPPAQKELEKLQKLLGRAAWLDRPVGQLIQSIGNHIHLVRYNLDSTYGARP